MKRVFLVLLVLLSLFFVACKKDKEPATTAPDFTDEDFMLTGDYALMLMTFPFDEGNYAQWLSLYAKSPVSSITINGKQIAMDYDEEDIEDGYYVNYPGGVFYGDTLLAAPGKALNYSFKVGGKSYSGSVTTPMEPETTFPVFNFNRDYKISWNISKSPNNYILDYLFSEYWNYDTNDYEDLVQLNGSARSYTISKTGWQQMDPEEIYYWVDLATINYKKSGSNLAFAVFLQGTEEDEWDKGSDAYPKHKAHRLFQKIQTGKLNFR